MLLCNLLQFDLIISMLLATIANNIRTNGFIITNGVRQRGVLSAKLLNVYINGLCNILNNSTTGGAF